MDGVSDWIVSAQRLIASTMASWLLRTASRISAWTSWLVVRVSAMVLSSMSEPGTRGSGFLALGPYFSLSVCAYYTMQSARFAKQKWCLLAHTPLARESAADVLTRCVAQRGIAPAAHTRWLDQVTSPRSDPVGPVLPPGAVLALRGGAPCLRAGRVVLPGDMPGLRPGRVDDSGYVPAAAQDVAHVAAEQVGRHVGRRP